MKPPQNAEQCARLLSKARADIITKNNEIIHLVKSGLALQHRDRILTEAMSEIHATINGLSSQPVQAIIAGCMYELNNAPGADISTGHPINP